MKSSLLRALLPAMLAFAACHDEINTPLTGPQRDVLPNELLTGSVLGPDGTSICNSVGGGNMTVRVYRIGPLGLAVTAASRTIRCPAYTFEFSLPQDNYFVRVSVINALFNTATLPYATIDYNPVQLVAGGAHRDLRIAVGAPMMGNAYLDGVPLAGVLASVQPTGPITAPVTSVESTPAGWLEQGARMPPVLQPGEYHQLYCEALGTRLVEGGPFAIPSPGPVDCHFVVSAASRYTHKSTQMIATMLAGDFGGRVANSFVDPGSGFGVQYPATQPAHAPVYASELFRGGLILSANGKILHTLGAGYFACPTGTSCEDFSDAADVSMWNVPEGRLIKWQFRDEGPDAVGLAVTQRSWDGRNGDYIVVHFTLENLARYDIDIGGIGVFIDYDLDGDPSRDIGRTAAGGKLMYVRKQADGRTMGTLLLGTGGVVHNYFVGNRTLPLEDQLAILDGTLTNPDAPLPMDQWYFHTAGPATIRKNGSYGFWVVLVGGRSELELMANAATAEQEVLARMQEKDKDPRGVPPWVVQNVITRSNGHACKGKPFEEACS